MWNLSAICSLHSTELIINTFKNTSLKLSKRIERNDWQFWRLFLLRFTNKKKNTKNTNNINQKLNIYVQAKDILFRYLILI